MKVKQISTGIYIKDQEIIAIELHPKEDCFVRILTYGAIIQNFVVLNKFGNRQDIVLGFDQVKDYLSKDYLANYPYLGSIIGRYANRIKDAKFTLNYINYNLAQNADLDFIHGGLEGFDKKNWQITNIEEEPNPCVTLGYFSKAGEEGFPGNLNVELKFTFTADLALSLCYSASTDQASPVNLTHHSYFNLNPNGGSIHNHLHVMPASNYLEQDDNKCVTGNLISVDKPENASHNFKSPKLIGKHWNQDEGYDQSFVLDKPYGEFGLASHSFSDLSGLSLDVYTTEPIAHFYTSKNLNVKGGKNGVDYKPFDAFCIETQHHPNAINIPSFPSTILNKGEKYNQVTTYKINISQ